MGLSDRLTTMDQNALDPLEGIETLIANSIDKYEHYQNALDPLEGIETVFPVFSNPTAIQ